jgi:heterodisulfide reductase subunit A-like polyferredoxin
MSVSDSEHKENFIGSTLIVGAGIAGMQAALDLAEVGIKVYLCDSSPAIGGTMAMLDKTFPTNDCAMCIMSPKLVEVGRHLNIELLTGVEILDIQGEPGNFTVRIQQHPRYVDLKKCTGCGDCAAVCPIEVPDTFNGNLSNRKAIYKLYPQAIPNAYAIDKRGTAPCREACPVHQRAQGYLALVAAGRYADAYSTILEENPFPSICGRVCNHTCEDACNRAQLDEAVNIMSIKRFVADWAHEHKEEVQSARKQITEVHPQEPLLTQYRVAVVGSGPAGLTCAQDLALLGCQVTVYEALPVPGGMMRVGVPPHRLPADVIQRDIDAILAEGIELVLNQRIVDAEALLRSFDAVFVASGAHRAVKLPIPGNDLPEVLQAIELLREVGLATDLSNLRSRFNGRRVLVLGGGDVAVDAAMTVLRLGASWVGMTFLESREKMPAHRWEIRDAVEEDIHLFPARTFKEITNLAGHVNGVSTAQVNFRGFINGHPDFDEIPETAEVIAADYIIVAIGQRPDPSIMKSAQYSKSGLLLVDSATQATSVPGIFAGGDATTGTSSIVQAIAAGHRAACSIKDYLLGENLLEKPTDSSAAAQPPINPVKLTKQEVELRIVSGAASAKQRHEVPQRPAKERIHDFDEIFTGFTEENAREEAARCLRCGLCSECKQCEFVCRAGAINHTDQPKMRELNVGAVMLTSGLEPIPGEIRPEYGYGRYPNVVTSLQFERMLSASGPFSGQVKRPSDHTPPRKIAWIQCVGSRDCTEGHNPYCSSVCCLFATKEAMIAKEHDPSIEPTLFYIDLRSFGKGFDAYIERAKHEAGLRYIRCMVSAVHEVPHSRNLCIDYVAYQGDDGKHPVLIKEEFDLVVLSVGFRPSEKLKQMADRLGIAQNPLGFTATFPDLPTQTSRAGVFVAGASAEPKDIPESVIEASCAAAKISALLSEARNTLTQIPQYPSERDVSDEPARIGVFICHCGINIGFVVNVPQVVEYALQLPGVIFAEHNLYTCSQDTQEKIRQKIVGHGLNRVVVASCTPRTHEPLFQETLRQAGLNPHLFEMANIREQDAWVHRFKPNEATQKAKQLVKMAVKKAQFRHSIQPHRSEVCHQALVIGGGLAGMTAALSIAQQGFGVHLIERRSELGGNLHHIYTSTPDGLDPQALLHKLVSEVQREPRIQIFTDSEVVEFNGFKGQYHSSVRHRNGGQTELDHGVVLIATGGQEIYPHEYPYGENPRIITQSQLEQKLPEASFKKELSQKELVMIQCVGSRQPDHPYCSRICCSQALKNALFIKRIAPDCRIVILYRDIRSYGLRELWYRAARQAGIIFIEYDESAKPELVVRDMEKIEVKATMQPENLKLTLQPDWVVLSTGIEPEPGNITLAQLLKLPLDENGFFLEAHVKLRPVDFAAEGIFLCGLSHSPRNITETMVQAYAAGIRSVTLLSKTSLEATPLVAKVNPRLCAACGLCIEICPYGARELVAFEDTGTVHAHVNETLCQGCGACVAACPNKATQQEGFEIKPILEMISSSASRDF